MGGPDHFLFFFRLVGSRPAGITGAPPVQSSAWPTNAGPEQPADKRWWSPTPVLQPRIAPRGINPKNNAYSPIPHSTLVVTFRRKTK